MSKKFLANPDILRSKAGAITNQAQLFKDNVDKVFTTVREMVTSDYLDPAARSIAVQIESYKDELYKMAQIIADYGNYCSGASTTVINNQNSIASSVKL